MVKLFSWGNCSEQTLLLWQGKRDVTTIRRANKDIVAWLKIGNRCGVESEFFKDAQGVGGQAISATLVAWKRGFVHHGHMMPKAMQGGCARSSGWTCTNDENLVWHASEAIGGSGYVCCDTSS